MCGLKGVSLPKEGPCRERMGYEGGGEHSPERRRNRKSAGTRGRCRPPSRSALPKERLLQRSSAPDGTGWNMMADAKLTGLGARVPGDFKESIMHLHGVVGSA